MATQILAPLPGIFFRKPSPDAEPFAMDGRQIESGATIGLVEAMKSFFPVDSDTAGKITFLVEDGAAVDADDPIAEVE